MRRRAPSVRFTLLAWLIWPLAALLAVGIAGFYSLALNASNRAYDRALLDPAVAMARHVIERDGRAMLDLPPVAQEVLRVSGDDDTWFSVNAPDGTHVAGSPDLPEPPARGAGRDRVFYDGVYQGRPVRVAALFLERPSGTVVLRVAETRNKRDELMREILLGEIVPAIVIALTAIALVWFAIGRGLAPLGRLRAEIESRSPRDLRPVDTDHAPTEVKPMVHALNELLRQLEATLDAQQRFIADAAHQLRTPLAGLQTHVELALRERTADTLRHTLRQAHSATQRTVHLTNQLLALARAEPTAHHPAAMQPVDLKAIGEDAVRLWVPRAIVRGLDLGFELEPAQVTGDARLLRELVDNLIDNAINYTPAGGAITLRTGMRGAQAWLAVEDSGCGIPEEERQRVFDRFYRASGAPGEGSGLGLAIVREIASRHDARISIDTPASGRGSLFTVLFPAGAEQSAAPRIAAAAGAPLAAR
jgi:two-component system sensor histidine kinase TctE